MVQTSVDISNNVYLDPEMSQEGRGCLVADQGSPIGSAHVIVHRGFGKILSSINLFLLFKNIYISYKQYIENNTKSYD